jgi:hypothetical protein
VDRILPHPVNQESQVQKLSGAQEWVGLRRGHIFELVLERVIDLRLAIELNLFGRQVTVT